MSAELWVFGEEVLWITAEYEELRNSGYSKRKMVAEQCFAEESCATSEKEFHVI